MSCVDCGRPTKRADSTALRCWKCKTQARQAACRRYYRKSRPEMKPCEGLLCRNSTLARRKWCSDCATAFYGPRYASHLKASRLERERISLGVKSWWRSRRMNVEAA